MHRQLWSRWIVTGICMVSLFTPPAAQAAGKPGSLIAVRDVALQPDGSLQGTLRSAEGKPQANVEVALRKGTEVVGLTKTQVDGTFAIRQVRPGLYELATPGSATLYRVWSARTAPPSAQQLAMVVQSNTIVRGQEEWSPMRRAVILGGIIVTSGIVGGVIGYNIKDDDSAS